MTICWYSRQIMFFFWPASVSADLLCIIISKTHTEFGLISFVLLFCICVCSKNSCHVFVPNDHFEFCELANICSLATFWLIIFWTCFTVFYRIWIAYFCSLFGTSYRILYYKSDEMWPSRHQKCFIRYNTIKKRPFMAWKGLCRLWAPAVSIIRRCKYPPE